MRSNGRILDDFKCVLGGKDCLEAEFSLSKIFEDSSLGEHSVQIQRWPRDLDLRKGLLSGLWKDVSALVVSRDACVSDKEGAGVIDRMEGDRTSAKDWREKRGQSGKGRGGR